MKKIFATILTTMLIISGGVSAHSEHHNNHSHNDNSEWDGFYLGGFTGYGWGERDVKMHTRFPNDEISLSNNYKYSPDGWLIGATLGRNWMFDHFLVGMELEAAFADIENKIKIIGESIARGKGEYKWLSTCSARMGYAFDDLLLYVKLGAALSEFRYEENSGANFSQNRNGYHYGTGLEYMLSGNTSLKFEYTYTNFIKESSYSYNQIFFYSQDFDVKASMHTIKFGFNYFFGK